MLGPAGGAVAQFDADRAVGGEIGEVALGGRPGDTKALGNRAGDDRPVGRADGIRDELPGGRGACPADRVRAVRAVQSAQRPAHLLLGQGTVGGELGTVMGLRGRTPAQSLSSNGLIR